MANKDAKIHYRKAVSSDLHELTILFDLYRIFYKKKSDRQGAFQFLKERMDKSESIIYVASMNGEIVGFTQCFPLYSSTRMSRIWLLNDLYILEDYRGLGISKSLIECVKDLSRKTKAAGVQLETEKSNTIGNVLYPKVGFELDTGHNFYFWTNHNT